MKRTIRTVAFAALAAAAAGAVALLVVKDQMSRHQRDLFSPHAFRRLAALGHMAREEPSVANITLLRDFIAWEPRRRLRDRAKAIHDRMADQVRAVTAGAEERVR
jgi:hypothetical protein